MWLIKTQGLIAIVLVGLELPQEQVMKIKGHKKPLTLQHNIKNSTYIRLMLKVGKKVKGH